MVETIAVKVVIAIAGLVVLLLILPKLFGRSARIRRKLRSARRCAIRDLVDAARGPRRIAGMVVAVGEPLIAPLSGRACVAYETQVIRAIGLDRDPWDYRYQFAFEKRCVPFLIDDGTGCAEVDPARAELLLEVDVDRSSRGRDADPTEDDFLARLGKRRRGLLFEKRLTFTESIIEVGERIAVVGVPVHDPATTTEPASPYRQDQPQPRRPRMARSSGSALIVTDDLSFAPPLDDA